MSERGVRLDEPPALTATVQLRGRPGLALAELIPVLLEAVHGGVMVAVR